MSYVHFNFPKSAWLDYNTVGLTNNPDGIPLKENRYGVVEQGKDGFSYLFSTRFASWSDAVDFAEHEAQENPGKYDYYVVYFDTKVSATQPKPTVTSTSSF